METVICPTCGGSNRAEARVCAHCSSSLISPPDNHAAYAATEGNASSPPSQGEGTGQINAPDLALLLLCVAIVAIGFLAGGFIGLFFALIVAGGFGALSLYGQKNWARWGLIVLLSIFALVNVGLFVSDLRSGSRSWFRPLLSLPLQLYLIWSLIRSRPQFD